MRKNDEDKINQLFGLCLDWSVIHAVKSHIQPFLDDRPTAHIEKTFLQMASGKFYYSRGAANSSHNIQAIHVKFTDGSVVCISLKRKYEVDSVFALCGHEKETFKSIEKTNRSWFVYVVECSDNSLYCGISTDVDRRVKEHNESSRGSKYTRSRRPVKLVRSWEVASQSEAMKAENRFKKLSRDDKLKILGKT